MTGPVRRSWLIVPAHDENALSEAADSSPDVVVLDLQDTVHDSRKHCARGNVREAIGRIRGQGAEAFVRTDVELMYADLAASAWPGLTGIVLPGATTTDEVREADRILGRFEEERGVVKPPPVGEVREADDPRGPDQALEIHLCLDTGRGNWDAIDLIGASDRVKSVSLGRADLVMDLREEPSGDLHLMPYLMQRLIVIAAATDVQPIGGWWRATSRGLGGRLRRNPRGRRGRPAGRVLWRAVHETPPGGCPEPRIHAIRPGDGLGQRGDRRLRRSPGCRRR